MYTFKCALILVLPFCTYKQAIQATMKSSGCRLQMTCGVSDNSNTDELNGNNNAFLQDGSHL